jgi:tetratricopeptide (TPR) repeat protein
VALLTAVACLPYLLGACGHATTGSAASARTLERGLAAHRHGHLDEAERLYRQALVEDRTNADADYDLGVIEQATHRLNQAELHYRTAIDLDPTLAPALFNLAILRTGAGAVDEAAAIYEQLLSQHPDDADAHLNLGFVELTRGDPASARQHFDRAVALEPALQSRIPTGQGG